VRQEVIVMQKDQTIANARLNEHVLNLRLEETGWAVFLILVGSLWLLPTELIPSQAWLLGAGLIMLGVNFARFFAGIRMSGFTVFLGVVALVAGLSGFFAIDLPIIPAVFIVLGFSLLMRALFKARGQAKNDGSK
jgi:hypothetical protein